MRGIVALSLFASTCLVICSEEKEREVLLYAAADVPIIMSMANSGLLAGKRLVALLIVPGTDWKHLGFLSLEKKGWRRYENSF